MALTKVSYSMITGAPVNVFDYIPAAQAALISANTEAGQNPTVITAAIQAAVNASASLYFPAGTYLINDTISKFTPNPTAIFFTGDGRFHTKIKAAPSMTNKRMFWFGNGLGHGAPRTEIYDMQFDGGSMANNNTGIYLQEGGLCHLSNLFVTSCGVGIGGYGATATQIDGLTDIVFCETGMLFDFPVGVSVVTGTSNELRIRGVWFSACNQAVYAVGDMIEISGCTAQSVGLDGTKHIFEVNNTNLGIFGFYGANIFNNWVEGGENKYAVALINAPSSKVYNNYIIGDGGVTSNTREGGVLVDTSALSQVYGNVFFQFFTRTPQNGRLANAAIYVRNSGNTGQNWRVYSNTLFRSQAGNQYYFEAMPAPTLSKNAIVNIWCYVTISGATATVENGQNVSSVVQVATGVWQVNFTFNRESVNTPVVVTPLGTASLSTSYENNGVGSIRVWFKDNAGVLTDPAGFNVMAMAEQNFN